MYEYEDFDPVYDYNEVPEVGARTRRTPSRYDIDSMTPAEIEAYGRIDEYCFYDR